MATYKNKNCRQVIAFVANGGCYVVKKGGALLHNVITIVADK